MDYKIKLDSFEGPLDLLLNLIDKAKIDIYDIPITLVTQQYMEYIYEMEDLNLEIASEFILMASTLLQIKSKMLLPEEPKDDCEDIEDPREELVLKLLSYKKYKEISKNLRHNESIGLKAFYKPREDLSIYEEEVLDLGPLDLNLIVKSINRIIAKRGLTEEEINIHEIARDEYSIKECSEDIIDLLSNHKNIKFTDLLREKSTPNEIVTYFLSVLELVKLKFISVKQDDNFEDLIITKEEIGEY